jgi:hypothetical protein
MKMSSRGRNFFHTGRKCCLSRGEGQGDGGVEEEGAAPGQNIVFHIGGGGGWGIVGFSSGRATGNLALRREDVFAFWCAHRTRLGA